jgi:hypothetical protein
MADAVADPALDAFLGLIDVELRADPATGRDGS